MIRLAYYNVLDEKKKYGSVSGVNSVGQKFRKGFFQEENEQGLSFYERRFYPFLPHVFIDFHVSISNYAYDWKNQRGYEKKY